MSRKEVAGVIGSYSRTKGGSWCRPPQVASVVGSRCPHAVIIRNRRANLKAKTAGLVPFVVAKPHFILMLFGKTVRFDQATKCSMKKPFFVVDSNIEPPDSVHHSETEEAVVHVSSISTSLPFSRVHQASRGSSRSCCDQISFSDFLRTNSKHSLQYPTSFPASIGSRGRGKGNGNRVRDGISTRGH